MRDSPVQQTLSYAQIRRSLAFVRLRQKVRSLCDRAGLGAGPLERFCVVLMISGTVFGVVLVVSLAIEGPSTGAVAIGGVIASLVLASLAPLVLVGDDEVLESSRASLEKQLPKARAEWREERGRAAREAERERRQGVAFPPRPGGRSSSQEFPTMSLTGDHSDENTPPVTINTWHGERQDGNLCRIKAIVTFNHSGTYTFAGGRILWGGSFQRGSYKTVTIRGEAGDRIPVSLQYSCGGSHKCDCGVFWSDSDVPRRYSLGQIVSVIVSVAIGVGIVIAVVSTWFRS